MIGFSIEGKFLDLYEDTSFTFTINNTMYTGGDPTSIPGSYSNPVSIPLSDHNVYLLGFPHVIGNKNKFNIYEGVQFYAEGLPLFIGDLYIKEPGVTDQGAEAEATFVVTPFKALKETYIDELHLETVMEGETYDNAKLSTENPELFNYAFFPIFNAGFSGKDKDELSEIRSENYADFWDMVCQNFYNISLQHFSKTAKAITPFVKVRYIVEQIFSNAGIWLSNDAFDNEEELDLLYQYSNKGLTTWNAEWNLQDQLPHIKSNEYIKQLASLLFVGIFSNVFTNQIKLLSLNEIVKRPHVHDWTTKISPNYKKADSDTPGVYQFLDDGNDNVFTRARFKSQDIDVVRGATSEYVVPRDGNKTIYYEGNNFTLYPRHDFLHQQYFWNHQSTGSGTDYEIKMVPLFMCEHLIFQNRDFWYNGNGPYNRYAPVIETKGYLPTVNEEGETSTDDSPLANRVIFYRGMQTVTHQYPRDEVLYFDGKYPMASNNVYNDTGEKIADQALLLNTENGIIAKRAKEWITFLENRDTIKRITYLNIRDIINFKPEDKVRIENMNYFVSQMKVTFTAGHIPNEVMPVETTYESTI